MNPVYLGNWSSFDDVLCDFFPSTALLAPDSTAVSVPDMSGVEPLLAFYEDTYGYSYEAFVLFRQGGKLYEVNGGHCSCYGLEGQWEPEETTVAALRYRMTRGELGGDPKTGMLGEVKGFRDELAAVLDALETPDA